MIRDSRFESQIAIAVKSRDLEHLVSEDFWVFLSFLAIAILQHSLAKSAESTAIARKREENREILTKLVGKSQQGKGTCGATPSSKTLPMEFRCPLLINKFKKSSPETEIPERLGLGVENCLRRGGVDRERKGQISPKNNKTQKNQLG